MLFACPCDRCDHKAVCRDYSRIHAEYIESAAMFNCGLTKIKKDINVAVIISMECENYMAKRED